MDTSGTSHDAPKVSVIIPAYNQAHYVSEAVESVLTQTFPNFEVVIVNDGSTDETPQILAGIQDPRVKVIWQPNAGLSAARNTGIRNSSAPLITLLDSDDFFLPDKLAVLVEYLENHPEIGMVSGGLLMVDGHSQPFSQVIKTPGRLELPELLFNNPFTPSAVMLRRFWLDRAGLFDETLRACEDWDLWQRMAYAGCHFAWIEHVVAAYRYHQDQMTRESERMRKAIFFTLEKFFNQPGLPENFNVMKNDVFASGLVHAAAYAYHARQFEKGQRDLSEALRLNPCLKDMRYKKMVDQLVGWANDPRSIRPAVFLQEIVDHPPEGHPGLKRELRRAVSDILLGPLFSRSRKDLKNHRMELIKAIRYKPDWLLNRGVLRLLAEAWLV